MSRRRRITHAHVRRLALALPEVAENSHLGLPDFRVRNRIFATLPRDSGAVIVKSSSPDVYALVLMDGTTFWDEWRARWLGIHLDSVPVPLLRDLLAHAWRLVAPKHLAVSFETVTK